MYAMVCTRPDIAHVVGMVSRFLNCPSKTHWSVAQWIMRYLRRSATCGFLYGKSTSKSVMVEGYMDSDFGGDLDKMKSISGYMFMLNMCLIS